ncbi:MAG: tRNA (N(6)-L-threonylcarbamoyladenosine(37)-C(2))-methylthiotransferase MtaB [Gammaproteobacteria bacterium]|nr:tRNA (N(6)-L-threonylcarbamoyladenosine(37)-C(2))-methylthiotransferase MtaB [Gammaproteobacteria bacterium]MBL6998878.1 tRNA (N(6)-L-threonylcarbamoyladenosine(37)-C(2))-methylthiotransferase MtaB [Gammaproteobacteria bacterium]
MKVNFQALGCRLNEAELESWSNQFIESGFQLTTDSSEADLVVFNSCSVTAEADRKSRKFINRIHKSNPQSRLVVTGCYASLQTEQVEKQLGVDLVVSNQQKDDLLQLVQAKFDLPEYTVQTGDNSSIFARGRHRAFIKIQDGCRYRCTFCIVTVARGAERSRTQQEIIEEIKRHHQHGVQEIVITGVHVGGYGSDTGTNLYELLSAILDQTAIPRIRLASVEPWDLPDNFFELFKDSRLMPHMHLPLQSGSDSVLRRMARRCKTAEFARLVDKARSSISFFNITTDLIVGFPGETEQEWAATMKFVENIGFGHMHIFSYSKREGTRAAGLSDQIPDSVKKQRSQQMHELATSLKSKAMQELIGQQCEVLWENSLGQASAEWAGYTPHYHKLVMNSPEIKNAQISIARISGYSPKNMRLVGDSPFPLPQKQIEIAFP